MLRFLPVVSGHLVTEVNWWDLSRRECSKNFIPAFKVHCWGEDNDLSVINIPSATDLCLQALQLLLAVGGYWWEMTRVWTIISSNLCYRSQCVWSASPGKGWGFAPHFEQALHIHPVLDWSTHFRNIFIFKGIFNFLLYILKFIQTVFKIHP